MQHVYNPGKWSDEVLSQISKMVRNGESVVAHSHTKDEKCFVFVHWFYVKARCICTLGYPKEAHDDSSASDSQGQ